MSDVVSVYDAKTHLSALLDRAAAGEDIVIARNGKAMARLVPIAFQGQTRQPANALRIEHIADDFDAPDPAIERMFAGEIA